MCGGVPCESPAGVGPGDPVGLACGPGRNNGRRDGEAFSPSLFTKDLSFVPPPHRVTSLLPGGGSLQTNLPTLPVATECLVSDGNVRVSKEFCTPYIRALG